MKNIRLVLEDEDYEKLIKLKGDMTWTQWMLREDLENK